MIVNKAVLEPPPVVLIIELSEEEANSIRFVLNNASETAKETSPSASKTASRLAAEISNAGFSNLPADVVTPNTGR